MSFDCVITVVFLGTYCIKCLRYYYREPNTANRSKSRHGAGPQATWNGGVGSITPNHVPQMHACEIPTKCRQQDQEPR